MCVDVTNKYNDVTILFFLRMHHVNGNKNL